MDCKDVSYVSTSIIRPASPNNTSRRIDLTPWDLFFLPHQYMQRGLLYKKPDQGQPKQEEANIIRHLKTSLSRTLDYFYPLAGCLATTEHDEDDTVSVYIDCNSSSGAEFIHATVDISISDILNPIYVPHIVRSFFNLNGVTNYGGRSQLLSVQVTELIDGIFIGCSINHVICDGTSFSHFFDSWAEISRGMDCISSPPILKRWFLENTDFPIQLPLATTKQFSAETHFQPQYEDRVFHFTPENIAKLKAKANLESETVSNISSLQALLAHVWIAFTRARYSDPNEETSYWLAIGNRARLNPPLPNAYFGNSVQPRFVITTAGELLERGLGFGASLLNQMVMSHDEVVIKSYWETWADKLELRSPYTTLVSGGSPRFDFYGNDFGWGRPVAVRSGTACKLDGKIVAIPGPVEGSIDIEASLSFETLIAMGDDTEFMEFVTVLPPN